MQSLCDDDQRASDASGGPFQRRCRTPCWSDGQSGDAPIEFNSFFPSRDFPPSRFEVHISLTTFCPIVIPSSTPPCLANSRAAAASKRHGFLPLHSNESTEAVAEHIPRDGTLAAHARSQSAVAPDPAASARMKLRGNGLLAEFNMENMGGMAREAHAWNGQSLGAVRYMANHKLRDASSPAFSRELLLVRPSASAPVTSCLAGAGAGGATPSLAPLRENSTVPSMFQSTFSSQGHASLPRSSYNLAALTPSASRTPAPHHAPRVDLRPSPGAHRAPPPPPPRDVSRVLVARSHHHPLRRLL